MPLNPNADRDFVNGYSLKSLPDQVHAYPHFYMGLKLDVFRHIRNLTLDFKHPISVISGSNRSGKTTALMAVACSHYNFKRPNVSSGTIERATWSSVVRFTSQDIQGSSWTYRVEYRTGNQVHSNTGSRSAVSNKWSGVAKKNRQIGRPTPAHPDGGRTVIFIDLNRINPGRHFSPRVFGKVRGLVGSPFADQVKINEYMSYILEDNYTIEQIAPAADSIIFKFSTTSQYSSFNTASGEDVLVNMLCQILGAPDGSLVLIDEIEVGLHPRIQRRLMDILYCISKDQHKQFILTSHAYAILDSVPAESRLFIDYTGGVFRCLPGLSTYEILTRMDCKAFPVASVYVEDDVSKKIVNRAISEHMMINPGFNRILRVVIVGSADRTFSFFDTRIATHVSEPNTSKPACVLDGDMENARSATGALKYPPQDGLFFHFSNQAPEKMLLAKYLVNNPNENLQYHLDHSNPHCLLQKMVDCGVAVDQDDAFNRCFNEYRHSVDGGQHFDQLKTFLVNLCN